jgi:hypothetical protein
MVETHADRDFIHLTASLWRAYDDCNAQQTRQKEAKLAIAVNKPSYVRTLWWV